jgi:hypothetical protein
MADTSAVAPAQASATSAVDNTAMHTTDSEKSDLADTLSAKRKRIDDDSTLPATTSALDESGPLSAQIQSDIFALLNTYASRRF